MSSGVYDSLNCGVGSLDVPANVLENRRRIAEKLGAGNLLTLHQVHSADVITVAHTWDMRQRPQADAMVTNRPGIALGILTADCVPILLADSRNAVIGAAHSGWKGAFQGIARRTVDAMLELGAERGSISAAIGPAIAQRSYEVDSAFRQRLVEQSGGNACYFAALPVQQRWLFDLKGFVRDSLEDYGVTNINVLENDTYIEEDAFFSYRRATHRAEVDYGRQVSAIMLTV